MLLRADARSIPLADLAYIAGLMDGEAYIGIKKSGPSNGRVHPGYQERIQIRMVDEEAIAFVAETFGGNYYKESPSVAAGRPLYCYQASDKIATAILVAVLPYLRVKREVAETVLELRNRKDRPHTIRVDGRRRLSDQEVSIRSMLYLECKRLNRVGKEAQDAPAI